MANFESDILIIFKEIRSDHFLKNGMEGVFYNIVSVDELQYSVYKS